MIRFTVLNPLMLHHHTPHHYKVNCHINLLHLHYMMYKFFTTIDVNWIFSIDYIEIDFFLRKTEISPFVIHSLKNHYKLRLHSWLWCLLNSLLQRLSSRLPKTTLISSLISFFMIEFLPFLFQINLYSLLYSKTPSDILESQQNGFL